MRHDERVRDVLAISIRVYDFREINDRPTVASSRLVHVTARTVFSNTLAHLLRLHYARRIDDDDNTHTRVIA